VAPLYKNAFYKEGRNNALAALGLISQSKTARVAPLLMRQRRSPFAEIARRLARAFKLKMPKFDLTKLLARLFKNPFRIPGRQLSGKFPVLKA
jgi:hypothetical protein